MVIGYRMNFLRAEFSAICWTFWCIKVWYDQVFHSESSFSCVWNIHNSSAEYSVTFAGRRLRYGVEGSRLVHDVLWDIADIPSACRAFNIQIAMSVDFVIGPAGIIICGSQHDSQVSPADAKSRPRSLIPSEAPP